MNKILFLLVAVLATVTASRFKSERDTSRSNSVENNDHLQSETGRSFLFPVGFIFYKKLLCAWEFIIRTIITTSCPVLTISLTNCGNTSTTPVKPGPDPDPKLPAACTNSDLVLLVDASGSISPKDFVTALEFAGRFSRAWRSQRNSRVSVILFATNVDRIFSLADSTLLSPDEVYNATTNAPRLPGGTNTHLGLESARLELTKNTISGTALNSILITDGGSAYPDLTAIEADNLQREKIRAFSVGVGSANYAELLTITGNVSQYVFTVNEYQGLLDMCLNVSDKVCDRVA